MAARLLAPLGAVYARATAARLRRKGTPVGIPVICVGNLHAGGTGKTPTVVALLQHLASRGTAAHVVTKGYGGRLTDTVRVDPTRHDAAWTGDEPLLLAAFAPVWAGPDRVRSARLSAEAGAEAVVLDDGFQDPALAKDLSVIVVDAETGFGNGRVLPAGPLREPVAPGLSRADLLISIGEPAAQATFGRVWGRDIPCPQLRGRIEPLSTGMSWAGLRAIAFAGIGRPEKAFGTMRELGIDLVRTVALDDHQRLTPPLLGRLEREAAILGAQLVTTEKDAVRLPAAFRSKVLTVPVRLKIDGTASLDAALDRIGL